MRGRWGDSLRGWSTFAAVLAIAGTVAPRARADGEVVGDGQQLHDEAQRLRLACIAQQDVTLCTRANEAYDVALPLLRESVERDSHGARAIDGRFLLADTLRWLSRHGEAYEVASALRDSPQVAARRIEAATLALEYAKAAWSAVSDQVRIPPRPGVGPTPVPPELRHYLDACDAYVRIPPNQTDATVRSECQYRSGTALSTFGYRREARTLFERTLEETCHAATPSSYGASAWRSLLDMAAHPLNLAWRDRLMAMRRTCTFARDRPDCSGSPGGSTPIPRNVPPWSCAPEVIRDVETAPPLTPMCERFIDLPSSDHPRLSALFSRAQSAPSPAQRQQWLEQATVEAFRYVARTPGALDVWLELVTAMHDLGHSRLASCFAEGAVREVVRIGDPRGQTEQLIVARLRFIGATEAFAVFDYEAGLSELREITASAELGSFPAGREQQGNAEAIIGHVLARMGSWREAARHLRLAVPVETDARNRAFLRGEAARYDARASARRRPTPITLPVWTGSPPLDGE